MDWILINDEKRSKVDIINQTDTEFLTDPFTEQICQTIRDWYRHRAFFTFRTSGSTGKPKPISIHRDQMIASAEATINYLDLSGGISLLCLEPAFIAGTMMIIRSILSNMNLVAVSPSSDPLVRVREDRSFSLGAMVPVQIRTILENKVSTEKLKRINNLLIGGADMDKRLIKTLTSFPNRIYQTFGMTETVSHIALKRINGPAPDDYFKVMPGTSINLDDRGCMIVTGKVTDNKPVVTNDLIELIDKDRFRWLGRYDHVINTGGIKIGIEQLEQKIDLLLERLDMEIPFFITSLPDDTLGQKICMVIESDKVPEGFPLLKDEMRAELSKYEIPKEFRKIPAFLRTPTDKINRNKSVAKAERI